jgi:hypothetical protein
MNAFTEHTTVRLPGLPEAETPWPHLRALKGSIHHDGPSLTLGQVDLLIEATRHGGIHDEHGMGPHGRRQRR